MLYVAFLFVIFVNFASSVPVKTLRDPVKVAQCRANCLNKHTYNDGGPRDGSKVLFSCSQDRNCYMCWETCELLFQNAPVWTSMCGSPHICFPGCQTACNYHREGYQGNFDSSRKWIFPSQLIFKKMETGLKVSWNAPISRKPIDVGTVLYIVLTSNHQNDVNKEWTEIIQTTELNATIPAEQVQDVNEVRTIAVTSFGVLASKTTPHATHKDLIGDDANSYNGLADGHLRGSGVWKAKLLSMVYDDQYGGVDATVTWPALRSYGAAKYEVTWQVKHNSMEITGHLYTESNVVALSLWPDAMYEVQIRCLSSKNVQDDISEVLVLDTSDVAVPTIRPIIEECKGCVRLEVFAGFAAGVAFILILTISIAMARCLLARKRTKDSGIYGNDKLKRRDAIKRKMTTVKVNGITGSISEMISEKERRESDEYPTPTFSKVCGRAKAIASFKSLGLQSSNSKNGESLLDLLEGDDDVFSNQNSPRSEPRSALLSKAYSKLF